MKRKGNLFERLTGDENLNLAIDEVNQTHRWHPHHKPNKVVAWVDGTKAERVKDRRVLDLIERVTRHGIQIGAYYSQWLANTVLQPMDHALRESGVKITHYIRYMDNITLYARSKRALDKAIRLVREWLEGHGMRLKDNWQKFRTADRLPCALGYRYGKGYTLLRKRNLFRLARQLRTYYRKVRRGQRIPISLATGLLSRLGQLRHCNSARIYRRLVKAKTQRALKCVVRDYMKKERSRWNTSTGPRNAAA